MILILKTHLILSTLSRINKYLNGVMRIIEGALTIVIRDVSLRLKSHGPMQYGGTSQFDSEESVISDLRGDDAITKMLPKVRARSLIFYYNYFYYGTFNPRSRTL
jgi:hypothetical protein